MSKVPATSTASGSFSPNFEEIFAAALDEYKKKTKRDIASNPLAIQLQSCDSPAAVLSVLRARVKKLEQSQSADEKWVKWVDPTVNVLFAFSATLGNGVGVVFPPANAVFTGIGVLLQAIQGVSNSKKGLTDLFGRLEFFFKRLEQHIKVPPTAAMKDIIVKIMAEVLSILGIVTKEVDQGRTMTFLKQLIGRKDVSEALQRLDQLTLEEARMAAAETLRIVRSTDDMVKVVRDEVTDVGDKVKVVYNKVKDVDENVKGAGVKLEGVGKEVQDVGIKVGGIDNQVRMLDRKLQNVDHKVVSVIQGGIESGVTIKQVAKQVSDLNRNELREKLRKWIDPPNPSVNYNTASDAHQEGTSVWCTNGDTVAAWKTSGSLLWIHGKPGSGKTILSFVIIRDIKSMSDTGSAFLAYFYFDFKDTTKQDLRALLSSFLVQLSDQAHIFYDALTSLYFKHNDGSDQPAVKSLAECLNGMLTSMEEMPIYLIVDALDECPDGSGIPSPRGKVLELVEALVQLRRPNLRICITSRPEVDIGRVLKDLATQQVSLHDKSGQEQDINDYVTFVVNSDRTMKRWRDDDKQAVIETLSQKADGMFRWVFCQLEVLRSCFPANLRRILDELPKSLDDTYMRILKQINNANWEHAYRLLQCLTVAVRPLRVEELAEVLAVDFHGGGMPKLNTNWRWEDQKGAVLSACSSLVSVVTDNDSEVVQFSHFSVKEFLSSDRLASYTAEESRFHIPIEPSHVVLVQACFVVLLRLDGDIDADAAAKIPLLRYAAGHWYRHAQIGNVELQITDTWDHFFDMDNPCFSAWAQLERPLDLFDYSSESENLLPLAAPLYFAAARGLPRLVERLIVKHPEHINDDGGVDGTPFHASARLGNIEISQLLHACGAKINSSGQTPLHIASQEGHLEVGRWLIDCGADVNSQDMDHCTPLHWAAARGQIGFSRMLLKHKSKVNVRDDTKATPFLEASKSGKPELLQLLLDYKAHPHVRDSSGRTPLHKAAAGGHVNIVRLLLELNAEVDARDDDGGTPLLRACEFWPGAPDVVQLLLDHNADLHVRDNKGRTGLHRAVAKGHLEVARLLLERNAEVNAQDDDGATPLLSASQFRKDIPDVVRLLLDNNADLHMHDDLGRTPLHHAVGRGHLEVARLLLERNAEVNAQDIDGCTLFLWASRRYNPNILQLLLDYNADENVCDKKGKTPLHFAAASGSHRVTQFLLKRNAEVNAQDDEGSTPLHQATQAERRSLVVVHLLLKHGADAHMRNLSGKTASELACGPEKRSIVRLLSKYTAK